MILNENVSEIKTQIPRKEKNNIKKASLHCTFYSHRHNFHLILTPIKHKQNI